MIALITILKTNIRLSVVKEIKFDMAELLPRFILVLTIAGLILLFIGPSGVRAPAVST